MKTHSGAALSLSASRWVAHGAGEFGTARRLRASVDIGWRFQNSNLTTVPRMPFWYLSGKIVHDLIPAQILWWADFGWRISISGSSLLWFGADPSPEVRAPVPERETAPDSRSHVRTQKRAPWSPKGSCICLFITFRALYFLSKMLPLPSSGWETQFVAPWLPQKK